MYIKVDGEQRVITAVIEGKMARAAQIAPNHLQINIDDSMGVQLSESDWKHLKRGGSISTSGHRFSDLSFFNHTNRRKP